MTDKPENPPVFPMTAVYDHNRGNAYPSGEYGAHGGMSLRDHFAGQALIGMLSALASGDNAQAVLEKAFRKGVEVKDGLAIASYEYADAMLRARAA